jgi:hypothetical protein
MTRRHSEKAALLYDLSSVDITKGNVSNTKFKSIVEEAYQAIDESDLAGDDVYKDTLKEIKTFHEYGMSIFSDVACMKRVSFDELLSEYNARRSRQKTLMDEGNFLQRLLADLIDHSDRFEKISVDGLVATHTDFLARLKGGGNIGNTTLRVSVKNRLNTISGGVKKNEVHALHAVADQADPNKDHRFVLPVFVIPNSPRTSARSRTLCAQNSCLQRSKFVETWCANFTWPFFTGRKYKDVVELIQSQLRGRTRQAPIVQSQREMRNLIGAALGVVEDVESGYTTGGELLNFFCNPYVAPSCKQRKTILAHYDNLSSRR